MCLATFGESEPTDLRAHKIQFNLYTVMYSLPFHSLFARLAILLILWALSRPGFIQLGHGYLTALLTRFLGVTATTAGRATRIVLAYC